MNNIKKIVIILIVAIMIIVISMLVITTFKTDEEQTNNNIATNNILNNVINNNITSYNQTFPVEVENNTEEKLKKVTNRNIFFSTETMISKYFLYLRVGNADAVLQLLDDNFISQNSINSANVLETMRANIPYDGTYKAKEMYSYKSNQTIYYIYGTLTKDFQKTPYYLVMYYDSVNMSYAIKPITLAEYNNYTTEQITETYNQEIELDTYNKISSTTLTEEEMANKYLRDYIQNARYNSEEAYNSLDEEYRENRFGSYNAFLAYLNEESKASQLASLDPSSIRDREEFASDDEYNEYLSRTPQKSLEKYQMYIENGQQYCICLDPYGNYYIFEIDGVMNYKLYLDTYTVDLNYFTSKYNDASASTKTQLNIERMFEAINNRDYTYVYNKLANNDTFTDYQNMVDYLENNLFGNNKLEFGTYSSNDEKTSYSLTITDGNVINSDEITAKIELELGEGQEYKIISIEIQKEGE